jgi:hypothetical protein
MKLLAGRLLTACGNCHSASQRDGFVVVDQESPLTTGSCMIEPVPGRPRAFFFCHHDYRSAEDHNRSFRHL